MVPDSLQNIQPKLVASRFDVRETAFTASDGSSHRREFVVHPGAVTVLPVLGDPKAGDPTIVMIRNERFAVGESLWELPAGTLDVQGEPPLETARRELIEEAGYEAASVRPLMMFYTCPGICTEDMHAFLAEDLTEVGQQTEAGEFITVQPMPLSSVIEMIRSGELRDGKTIATLLFYKTIVRGGC